MEKLSEKEIIQKIKEGEINYFEHFVKRHSKPLYYYIKKKITNEHDISDILQNSFIKAYKAIDKFDIEKDFYPYLFTIVKNEMTDYFRKHKNDTKLEEETAGYEQNFISEEKDLNALMRNIRTEYKKVIKLYYLEGFSYNEIAGKINKPINTVKTLLRRAKLAVRKNYEKSEKK